MNNMETWQKPSVNSVCISVNNLNIQTKTTPFVLQFGNSADGLDESIKLLSTRLIPYIMMLD